MSNSCNPDTPFYRRALLSVAVLYAGLTLLPGMFIGFGSNPDGWRSYSAGQSFFSTGVYHPSRTPGNPIFEWIAGFLSLFGSSIISNSFVLLTYIISIIAFWRLAHNSRCRYLITALYALTPILVINSNSTHDYVPGLAFLLCAYALVQTGKIELSAILLALSVGIRISNCLFIFPAVIYLYLNHYGIRRIFRYCCIAASLSILFYLPIFMQDGISMFKLPVMPITMDMYIVTIIYRGVMLLGPLATGVLLFCLFRNLSDLKSTFSDTIRGKNAEATVELLSILLFSLLFIRHPFRTEYLLPIIPFVYLNISRWLSYKELIAVTVAVLLFGIITVDMKGGKPGERRLAFNISNGIIYRDFEARKRIERIRTHIANSDITHKAIILTGMGETLTFQNPDLIKADWQEVSTKIDPGEVQEFDNIHKIRNASKDIYLVYSMSEHNIQVLRDEGYSVYYLDEAIAICVYFYKYHPRDFGSKLDISDNELFASHPS
jgi:hypothetical protein